jgi:hypothetical protein
VHHDCSISRVSALKRKDYEDYSRETDSQSQSSSGEIIENFVGANFVPPEREYLARLPAQLEIRHNISIFYSGKLSSSVIFSR